MTILDRIRADALVARKTKRPEAGLLTTLIGEIETRTKALKEPRALTEEELIAVVRKFLNGAEETLAAIETRRPDETNRLRADIRTLETYLPAQLSEDELRAFAAARVRAGDGMGQVMAALKADFPGQYDGKLASAVVRGLLAA